jgi:pyridoxal biosynthesis lyase PdxS
MPVVAMQNKSLTKMAQIMSTKDLSYNEFGKTEFKRTSTAALRQIAKDLGLKVCKASFNAGGIAVSGDATLMGLWQEGKGIYVTISQGFGGNRIMYRTITHMKDYTGGMNQWADVEEAAADYESIVERFFQLKR